MQADNNHVSVVTACNATKSNALFDDRLLRQVNHSNTAQSSEGTIRSGLPGGYLGMNTLGLPGQQHPGQIHSPVAHCTRGQDTFTQRLANLCTVLWLTGALHPHSPRHTAHEVRVLAVFITSAQN